ncbi:MAG: patatin-like phospholipase family protein [Burkholderiales bacterium]|nr:patatin-like phospholipase family protein [Burkholderiales bacterium]
MRSARLVVRVLLLASFAFVQPACAQPAAGIAAAAAADVPANARPKIGLVLSGGGARGLTHIGVLRVLQQMKIPIDYIAGTSMGAIVGGLYASGMSPAEMQRQLGAVNWPTLLSDNPPRPDVGFRRKEEETAFPMGFEIGYRDGEIHWFKGALSGNNLELYLHELTRGVDHIQDFDKLPIPFRAVATNMVTGQEVVFRNGSLYHAMRASMSVPGMFAPMELDGQILGDGGLVNNLPVDVVRAMGADIVIAVNIGTPLMSRDQLQSVVGYASQMINILTEQNVRVQLAKLRPGDILISPDLGHLTFLDFTAAGEFVYLGAKAAEAVRPQLAALSAAATLYAQAEQRFAVPPPRLPETLDFVTIEGTGYTNPQVLAGQMETQPGRPFSMRMLENDLARLYGRGDFSEIDYQLVDSGRGQGLVVDVTEKSWGPNFLRFGVSLSADLQGDTFFNAMVGHRRVWVNSLGAEWSNEVVLGTMLRYATEFYQPLTLRNRVFASAYGLVQRALEFFFDDDQRIAEYSVLTQSAGADLGTPFGTSGELRIGYKWLHQNAGPEIADKTSEIYQTIKTTETGVRALFRWDTLDNPNFPRSGLRVNADALFGHRKTEYAGMTFYDGQSSRAGIYANLAHDLWKNGFVNVAVRAGGITAASEKTDPISDFNLGGFLNLSGLRTDQLSNNYLGFARAVYYHQIGNLPLLGRGVYIGGSLEAGNVWFDSGDASLSDLRKAGSVFVAADTWAGPFYFAWGLASGGQSSFYIFLGRL